MYNINYKLYIIGMYLINRLKYFFDVRNSLTYKYSNFQYDNYINSKINENYLNYKEIIRQSINKYTEKLIKNKQQYLHYKLIKSYLNND